jgi:hypothetical protein
MQLTHASLRTSQYIPVLAFVAVQLTHVCSLSVATLSPSWLSLRPGHDVTVMAFARVALTLPREVLEETSELRSHRSRHREQGGAMPVTITSPRRTSRRLPAASEARSQIARAGEAGVHARVRYQLP